MHMVCPVPSPVKGHRPPHPHHHTAARPHRRPLAELIAHARAELASANAAGTAYERERAAYAEALLRRAAAGSAAL